jgi:hypothetical protein
MVIATWAEELERVMGREADIYNLCRRYCKENPGKWAPGLDELLDWVTKRLTAIQKEQQALPEPKLSDAKIAANKRRVQGILKGLS